MGSNPNTDFLCCPHPSHSLPITPLIVSLCFALSPLPVLRPRCFRCLTSASSALRHQCLRLSTLSSFRSPPSMNNRHSHGLSVSQQGSVRREAAKMPFISKIQRQSDYSFFPSSCPIVIDNGASYFRIGYSIQNPNFSHLFSVHFFFCLMNVWMIKSFDFGFLIAQMGWRE